MIYALYPMNSMPEDEFIGWCAYCGDPVYTWTKTENEMHIGCSQVYNNEPLLKNFLEK